MYVDKRCCGLFAQQVFCWPMSAQMDNVAADFAELKRGFPGVFGAVDGCHVPIFAPDYCQMDYLDRNHRHSVNMMAVCDASKLFTYCFAGYPGSIHDQRVLSNSSFGDILNSRPKTYYRSNNYHIIGDSAFQLHPHVMVPYKDTGNLTATQLRYNRKLCQTGRVVENAFRLMKGRFHRLKQLECKLSRVPNNILTCCVLHNLTVINKSEIESLMNDTVCVSASDDDVGSVSVPAASHDTAAKQKRDAIPVSLI